MGYGGGGGKILVVEATGSRSRRRLTVVLGARDEIQVNPDPSFLVLSLSVKIW
jgi:hypothetical protein